VRSYGAVYHRAFCHLRIDRSRIPVLQLAVADHDRDAFWLYGGGLWSPHLSILPMALFSYFGIGAAAGVVVNDNLVLIDYVRRLEREGMSRQKRW